MGPYYFLLIVLLLFWLLISGLSWLSLSISCCLCSCLHTLEFCALLLFLLLPLPFLVLILTVYSTQLYSVFCSFSPPSFTSFGRCHRQTLEETTVVVVLVELCAPEHIAQINHLDKHNRQRARARAIAEKHTEKKKGTYKLIEQKQMIGTG